MVSDEWLNLISSPRQCCSTQFASLWMKQSKMISFTDWLSSYRSIHGYGRLGEGCHLETILHFNSDWKRIQIQSDILDNLEPGVIRVRIIRISWSSRARGGVSLSSKFQIYIIQAKQIWRWIESKLTIFQMFQKLGTLS